MPPSRNSADLLPLCNRAMEAVILRCPQRQVTVAQFLASAQGLAEKLPDKPYVINLHRDRHQFLLTFCASLIAGQGTLMPPNRQPQTLAELESAYPGSYRLGDIDETMEQLLPRDGEAETRNIPRIPAQQPAVIAFTSGSTGKPSANLKTWHMLVAGTQANCRAMLNDLPLPASLLATVPAQHMWGMETTVLMPLFADLAISPANPLYPQDIVTALQQLPAPRLLVSSPLHLKALLQSGLQLPPLERVFSATAPLTRELAVEFEAALSTTVLDVFGSSETGIFACRKTAVEELWNLSAGFQIQFTGNQAFVSAAHLPAATPLADRLELVNERQFRWLARAQDQVNVAGKRASLADLNRRLLAIDGVEDGVIFKPAENAARLAALVVAPALDAAGIRRALRQEIDPVFLPRPVVFVARMPRSETGKLPLSAVKAVFSAARQAGTADPA